MLNNLKDHEVEKEEEKLKPHDKPTEWIIEKSEVKNSFGKRTRIQMEGDMVVDEVSNAIICLIIDTNMNIFNKSISLKAILATR